MRRASRTDANQASIMSALTDAYMTAVFIPIGCGVPDLLVGGSMPCPNCERKVRQNKLLEVKTATGKLTRDQQIFHRTWAGRIEVVRTVDEALKAVGIL